MGLVMFVQNGAHLLRRGGRHLPAELAARPVHAARGSAGASIASIWFRRASNKAYLNVRDRIGANLSNLQEGLAGVRVVQAFGRERSFTRALPRDRTRRSTTPTSTPCGSRRATSRSSSSPASPAMAVIIGVGGWFVAADIVTVGTVAAFVLYLNNLFEPIQQLSHALQHAAAVGRGVAEAVRPARHPGRRSRSGPAPSTFPTPARSSSSTCRSATLDHDVLHDVSLTIEPGERIALVGPTGAGKSTLAKLIARFYDPREGEVRFGGVDAERHVAALAAPPHRRRAPGGLPVPGHDPRQRARRARPTPPTTRSTRRRRRARPHGAVRRLPRRPRHRGPRAGSRLSAGERQLVSLVRAALADPTLLVLDEATSSLDPGTERMVERALDAADRGAHGRRRRAPPVDRGPGRPGRRRRRRAARRGRDARRTSSPGKARTPPSTPPGTPAPPSAWARSPERRSRAVEVHGRPEKCDC